MTRRGVRVDARSVAEGARQLRREGVVAAAFPFGVTHPIFVGFGLALIASGAGGYGGDKLLTPLLNRILIQNEMDELE